MRSAGNASNSRRRWRKPALKIPAAFRILDEDQAGAIERQSAKFETPKEKREQTKACRQAVRAQEIFISERRVFTNSNPLRIEARKREERRTESLHIHASTKRALETGDHRGADAMRPQNEIHAELQREYEENEGYAPLPMFSESDQTLCHRFRGKRRQKSRRVGSKKVAKQSASRLAEKNQ